MRKIINGCIDKKIPIEDAVIAEIVPPKANIAEYNSWIERRKDEVKLRQELIYQLRYAYIALHAWKLHSTYVVVCREEDLVALALQYDGLVRHKTDLITYIREYREMDLRRKPYLWQRTLLWKICQKPRYITINFTIRFP